MKLPKKVEVIIRILGGLLGAGNQEVPPGPIDIKPPIEEVRPKDGSSSGDGDGDGKPDDENR
jgi:hypothetical protein